MSAVFAAISVSATRLALRVTAPLASGSAARSSGIALAAVFFGAAVFDINGLRDGVAAVDGGLGGGGGDGLCLRGSGR